MGFISSVIKKLINTMSSLTTSTEIAIGKNLLNKIQHTNFCLVGCGGVGSLFAEMLVRTGAINIILIDFDKVEHKNLNRMLFTSKDIDKFKVDALKERLVSINSKVKITTMPRIFGFYQKGDKERQEVRDLVVNSDFTIIVVDNNKIRIECEKLLNDFYKDYLVIGVEIKKNYSRFVCGWKTKTPKIEEDLKGYGENNASYMSIVSEATSVGFNLMLHHMNCGSKENKYIERKYENYFPISNN